jgi:hypothetical protein
MDFQGIISGIERSGVTSVRAIAEELNRQGISAPRGGSWHPTSVARLLNRLPHVACPKNCSPLTSNTKAR